jgi:hypothetical protein
VEDAAARQAVRAEIEALEHELAELEPLSGEPRAEAGKRAGGARLVSTQELESTRDALAARVTELRRARRQARSVPAARPKAQTVSAWPELLPLGAA